MSETLSQISTRHYLFGIPEKTSFVDEGLELEMEAVRNTVFSPFI